MIKAQIRDKGLRVYLTKLAKQLSNTSVANKAAAVELFKWVGRNFDTEGKLTEDGQWAGLAESTKKAKAKRGYSMILQNEGNLRQSFAPFSDARVAGVGAQNNLEGDRPWDLARIHHEGAPARNIPARPMLPTQVQALEIGIKVYGIYVQKAIKP